ncbi:TIGR03986 family CRISPR-associated RAMP protein [Limnospira sp. PMC 1042.18]|uniref:TIGR03986 family type III CRISPR-associated RAMP protein n=1 Tax=Limnospira sp. PMC 1042.18 TaxID=2981018 RepID=UPI0028ED17E5|nr:TIGR03986 family CRISPR-associated RAMP protein [Limnospira sp. PMC 1042.18]
MMSLGNVKVKVKINQKGNSNRSFEFSYTNSKGQFVQKPFTSIPEEQISIALLQKVKTTMQTLTVKVLFEEEGDRILKMREEGQPWDRDTLPEASSEASEAPKNVNPKNFHNPYNFVPAPPRKTDDPELGDRKPVGHGCYHSDRWTGRISVKLKTITPLLIPDASEMTENNDHKTYPVRLGADGKPYLPPTSIKGMLRSAYEAVTNSRLSVFFKHDKRLAYRMSATEGTTAKPARVEKRGHDLYLRILEESSCIGGAAKLPRYDKYGESPDKGEKHQALKYNSTKGLPQHGDRVRVQLSKGKVTQIERWDDNIPGGDWKLGWVCVTGANIGGKQNERVFIQNGSDVSVKVNDNIVELWEDLIADYQKTHEKDLAERDKKGISPSAYVGNKPGQTAWSRHVYEKSEAKLQEGTLCYVELQKGYDPDYLHHTDIIALQPVTISRRLYDVKPEDLLPKSLHPAENKQELSPADRVFGWVKQNGQGSYKGHLRVHSVQCQTSKEKAIAHFGKSGVPLAILGQPKPAQTRFYCAEDKNGKAIEKRQNKEHGYESRDRGLRGRKVYPHHNHLPEGYWDNPVKYRTDDINGYYQEYRRPSGENERDSQNRSITGWVNPGTEFTFDIDVSNLSNVELGGLLWLLSLPNNSHHRLGGGKPLGFGSVRLDIDLENSDWRTGQGWREFYRSLTPITPTSLDPSACIRDYQNAVQQTYGSGKSFEQVSFIAAFLQSATGFNDGSPIHYPRTSEKVDPEGKNYEWFTDNEGGDLWSLPSLESGKSLPLKSRTNQKAAQGRGNAPTSAATERAKPSQPKSSQPKSNQPKRKR